MLNTSKQNQVPAEDAAITGFTKSLYNKYYVDEIYDSLFKKQQMVPSRFFRIM
jgi:NADH-quinone oxidoreductase subunit L